MYYFHPCSYCSKVFYTFSDNKQQAAAVLYAGIKKHLIDYSEDDNEHQFDDGQSIDTQEVYTAMTESKDPPAGGYELS